LAASGLRPAFYFPSQPSLTMQYLEQTKQHVQKSANISLKILEQYFNNNELYKFTNGILIAYCLLPDEALASHNTAPVIVH
jgi:hypothetical protein